MDEHCRKCGEKLKENAQFCQNCGEKVPGKNKPFFNKYLIIIVIILIFGTIVLSAMIITSQTQTVKVDNVEFEIPSDYVNEPSRTEVSVDEGVKSSAMGWSNDKNYIEIGVTRMPGSGINSNEVAASIGGTPTKMFGYSGYYQKHDENSYSFVFGLKDEVCMIYVSNYDAFGDVKVLGIV
ncbi:zinc ribbon domain-containing protein [Methanobrevibacter sp.]|uniref:zinc ribbon domain-containing protein n=1 Tax=Methanobrevibacter sp. TaxID=66852 RepID=UPI0025D1FE26|nr:zinc ribbon domain-containing protein [Methanobrevibacter sp.]MBQ6099905.1 zinc ribbon domain-containing protein [Methanobrevibacter sp.]MBQ6513056.1 zinc ribbon domain-containing protein [Methanobrevibacter sp.]